jgi:hypothetical protein
MPARHGSARHLFLVFVMMASSQVKDLTARMGGAQADWLAAESQLNRRRAWWKLKIQRRKVLVV